MMKRLIVQIQLENISGLDQQNIIKKFETFCFNRKYVNSVEIEKRSDIGNYLFLYCETVDTLFLLKQMRKVLFKDKLIASVEENEAISIYESNDTSDLDIASYNKSKGFALDSFVLH